MENFFRRFKPDSFLGRLLAGMLLAVLLLFSFNVWAVQYIRNTHSNLAKKSRADTIASFFLLVAGMDREQRDKAIEQVARFKRSTYSSLHFEMLASAPDWPGGVSPETAREAEMLRVSLKNNGMEQAPPIKSRVVNKAAEMQVQEPPKFAVAGEYPMLQQAIMLDGQNWLGVTQPFYTEDPRITVLQRKLILAEFLVFVLIVILLLKQATRPLQKLTRAVEVFGIRPEVSPPLMAEGSRELREAAQSFNRMRERIRRNLAERDRMLAAMGHDLRTPLARAHLRLEGVRPEDVRDKLRANITEIESIIEQSLELAGSLKSSEQPVTLDIVSFVQSLVDDSVAQGHPVSMRFAPAGKRPVRPVTARSLCLRRCLENLISNALKYGGNAEVVINCCNDAPVSIDVQDDGPGIPEEHMEQVFEPYYRLEISRNRSSGGIGLGLSIARNMAALDNMTLTLQNRPEGGLSARLVLPRAAGLNGSLHVWERFRRNSVWLGSLPFR